MGGLKRKIDTEKKIERKDPRAVAFSKRRKGIFSKASKLCLLSDAQIAIILTPVSSNSHASFYSFGHSSVDSVVAAFLADPDDEKLGFWWEDESLANPGDAIDSVTKTLHYVNELKNKQRDRVDVEKENNDNNNNNNNNALRGNVVSKFDGMPMNGVSTYHNPCSDFEAVVNREFDRDFYDNNMHLSDLDEDQILAISDNNNNNNVLPENKSWFSQELDIDYETNSESLLMDLEMDGVSMAMCPDSETVEDGGLVIQRDLDEDSLCFSDFFNELTSTDAL